MARVLVTAFEPYGPWEENSSWLTLVQLTRDLPPTPEITTRLYPVEYSGMRERLAQDLAADYEYALHLGQMPGASHVVLESVGINMGGSPEQPMEAYERLVDDGPVAYQTALPIAQMVNLLRAEKIPATLSFHAGLYLCNATMYLSHYLAEQHGYLTKSLFVHLPLCPDQVIKRDCGLASMPTNTKAKALRLLLNGLVQ